MKSHVLAYLTARMEDLDSGRIAPACLPTPGQDAGDFACLLEDLEETPSQFTQYSESMPDYLPWLKQAQVRQQLARFFLTDAKIAHWISKADWLESPTPPCLTQLSLPVGFSSLWSDHEAFESSAWAKLAANSFHQMSIPVVDLRKSVLVLCQLTNWVGHPTGLEGIKAGQFFSGHSVISLGWLRNYARAKSLLRRDFHKGYPENDALDVEELRLARAIFQVPLVLTQVQANEDSKLIKPTLDNLHAAFRSLWSSKPILDPRDLDASSRRRQLLVRFTQAFERICDAGGIQLASSQPLGRM